MVKKMNKKEIANQLFELANKLAGEETGHLAAIVHAVVSELVCGADAFNMILEVQQQMELIKSFKEV